MKWDHEKDGLCTRKSCPRADCREYARLRQRRMEKMRKLGYRTAYFHPVHEAVRLMDRQMVRYHFTTAELARAADIAQSRLWKMRTGKVSAVSAKIYHRLQTLPNLSQAKHPDMVPYLATAVRVGALARAGVGIHALRAIMHNPSFDVRVHRQFARLETALQVIDALHRVDDLPKNLRVAAVAKTQGKRTIESIDPSVLYDPCWDGTGAWRIHGPRTFHPAELYGRVATVDREIHHDQLMFRVQGMAEEDIRERLGLTIRDYYRVVGRPFRQVVPSHYGLRRRAQVGIVLGWLAVNDDGRPEALRTALGTSIIDLATFAARLGLVHFDGVRFQLANQCARIAQERGTIRP